MPKMFPEASSEPKTRTYRVRFVGAGAANPTKVHGSGLSITWVSTGRYRLTWVDAPGHDLVDFSFGAQATTPGDLKALKVVLGAFDAANKRVDVYLYDAAAAHALVDLAAAQWLSLQLAFSGTKITPIA